MEMKVDSNLIRSERENRGWSQEHLGNVAGLSLRTIQRIESTGSASFESATALAAVLAMDVAALRARESEPARVRALHLSLELPVRLLMALISGLLCALLYRWRDYGNGWGPGVEGFDCVIAGALFGGAVLCPYLRLGPAFILRALALIGASALSYFCAVMTAMNAHAWFTVAPALMAFLCASFVGVNMVLLAARSLTPLRVTAAYWLLGVVASLVGGVAMYVSIYYEVFGNTTLSTAVGYCAWHMLVCLAIHRGRQSHDVQSGLLADFANTRGRFSIVPGWLRLSHQITAGLYGDSRGIKILRAWSLRRNQLFS